MRTYDYIAFAAKDLRRQFVRTLLTVIALSISTAVLVAMAAISIGGQQAISRQFGTDASLSLITVTPSQGTTTLSPYGNIQELNVGASKLTDATVAELLKVPHVATASPRVGIWELHHFNVAGNPKQFVAQAQGIPSDAPLSLQAGTRFEANNTKNVVIVGQSYVKELGYATSEELIGKPIQLVTQEGYRGDGAAIPASGASRQVTEEFNQQETMLTAKVVGVTASGPDQNALFLPLGWARDIRTARYNEATGVKKVDQLESDGYSAIRVMADSSKNAASVSDAIKQLGYGQISIKEQMQNLEQFTTMMWVTLGVVALIAIVAAALGVANTMLMAVSEQSYTIGVWRAVGARRSVIIRLFLVQAMLLGLIGGTVGMLAGAAVSNYVTVYINSILASQNLALSDVIALPWWLLASAVALTIVFAVLAGLYPAYKAAKVDPSAALRGN